jgi:hypothetical protein
VSGCGSHQHPSASAAAPHAAGTAAPAASGAPVAQSSTKASAAAAGLTSASAAPQASAQQAGQTGAPGKPDFVPPANGTYTYSGTDSSGKSQTFSLTAALSRSGSATTDVTTLKSSDGKSSEKTTSSWGSDQVLVTDVQFGDANCHWSPATPLVLGPLAAGKKWNIDSRCVITAQGHTVHVHEQGSATVQQPATATVGGESRPAWWMVTAVTITIQTDGSNGPVTIVDKSTRKDLTMPSVGLAASIEQHDEWSGFGQSKTTDEHLTLKSLRPA